MSGLGDLQRRLQSHVLSPGRDMAAHVVASSERDADVRLGIYVDAYRLRLIAALRENYARLRTLLGDPEFDRLARIYIQQFPSRHANIRWVGQQMPEFLGNPGLAGPVAPALAELAVFERALRNAFDAADAPVVSIEALAAVPAQDWPSLRPVLHPSVQRLECDWNTADIWQALGQDRPAPHVEKSAQPTAWVIWRKGLHPNFRSLDTRSAWALDAVREGADLQALCAGAARWSSPDQVPTLVARWLRSWVSDGMISRISD